MTLITFENNQTEYRFYRLLNRIIEILVISLAVFFILAPLTPYIGNLFNDTTIEQATSPKELFTELPVDEDYIIIPSLGIRKQIVESDSIKKVHELVWRRPQGSIPDQGSNTVMVAHRYANIGGERASTFYNLPDINLGADIYVRWKGKIYHYMVNSTDIVLPTEIEIEDPTTDPILTLYTCTPLWTSDKRFVVIAPLVNIYE